MYLYYIICRYKFKKKRQKKSVIVYWQNETKLPPPPIIKMWIHSMHLPLLRNQSPLNQFLL